MCSLIWSLYTSLMWILQGSWCLCLCLWMSVTFNLFAIHCIKKLMLMLSIYYAVRGCYTVAVYCATVVDNRSADFLEIAFRRRRQWTRRSILCSSHWFHRFAFESRWVVFMWWKSELAGVKRDLWIFLTLTRMSFFTAYHCSKSQCVDQKL